MSFLGKIHKKVDSEYFLIYNKYTLSTYECQEKVDNSLTRLFFREVIKAASIKILREMI